MKFNFGHDFDIHPEGFWQIFWSDDFNRELYRQLNMRSRQVLEQKDEGNTIRRSQKLDPTTPIPSWAASIIKDTSYTEHDVFHKDRSSMDVRIEPSLAKDRFQMSGVFAVTPLGAPGSGRCRREFTGEVKISVPLVGGKVEHMMVDQMKEAYETAARVTREFVAKHKALG